MSHLRYVFLTFFVAFCSCACLQAQKDLYALEKLVNIEISIPDEHWKAKLTTYKENHEKKRVAGEVKINGVTFKNIGIRFKGNSSFFAPLAAGSSKLPLNLKLTFEDKEQLTPEGYQTIKLSNVFRDPSYLREVLSYTIAARYLPAPRANFAKVSVNGEYWGLYNLTQSIDEQFSVEHYGHDKGILFKCDPSWEEKAAMSCRPGDKASLEYLGTNDAACYVDKYELKYGGEQAWPAFMELLRQLKDKPEQLEDMLNIDEAIWMHAFNNVLVNLDSYTGRLCHNYYLMRDTFSVWHPLLWDMNLSLGGFRFSGVGGKLSNQELMDLSLFLHFNEKSSTRPLIVKLLDIPLYRKIYVAHVKTIYEDYLAEDQYRTIAEPLREMLRPLVQAEPQALYDIESFEKNYTETVIIEEKQEIIGVDELLQGRKRYFAAHPLMQLPTPTIAEQEVLAEGGKKRISVRLEEGEEAQQLWLFYRSTDYGPWKRTAMEQSTPWDYAATLPSGDLRHYYLVAEGKVTASVLPVRSAKEWFSVLEG